MTRNEWFAMLAALAYPADPSRAGIAFKPFSPWFDDLPAEAFTRGSLEAVITSARKMAIPSYDEIRKPLAAWWRDNRPAAVRLQSEYQQLEAPAPRGEPTAAETAAVAEVVRGLRATTGTRRSGHVPDEAERPRALPLPDAALLAAYEITANDPNETPALRGLAAVRVRTLQARLGIDPQPVNAASRAGQGAPGGHGPLPLERRDAENALAPPLSEIPEWETE